MTDRERLLATLRFERGVPPPNYELGLWGQTIDRWIAEGAAEEEICFDWFRGGKLGLDRREFAPVYTHAFPRFAYEVLEEDEETLVHRDEQGVVTRALKTGAARGTRASMDQHLRHPVHDRESFLAYKKRYLASSPERYPAQWPELVAKWRARDYPLCLQENCGFGLFSHLRIWMGTEPLCIAFYEQPALVHEMLDFLAEFFCEAVSRAVREVQFDYFNFFEDFAYKAGPFLSPKLFREFLIPRYRVIIDFLRRNGVAFFMLDSDGNTEALLDSFVEIGITCHWPFEAAADMDPVRIRKRYGRDLVISGGIDKRALAKDKQAIEQELYAKLPPLLEDGGFIPTLDHTAPPDISWDNFRYYLELKRKLLGR
jgi:hypothetical protein